MIILDTNIISSLMRKKIDPAILQWFSDQNAKDIWTTSISIYEIEYGIQRLAEGRQKNELRKEFDFLLNKFGNFGLLKRVLSFDDNAAFETAKLSAAREKIGKPLDLADLQIAGIVKYNRARLATLNIKHFTGLGILLMDPAQPL